MIVMVQEISLHRTQRAIEEAQAEVNRTNNIKVILLEDKGSRYHYVELIIKNQAIGDITTELLLLIKNSMVSKYGSIVAVKEIDRKYIGNKIVVKVGLKKILGNVKEGHAEYRKSITEAKRALLLDTANTNRAKERGTQGYGKDE